MNQGGARRNGGKKKKKRKEIKKFMIVVVTYLLELTLLTRCYAATQLPQCNSCCDTNNTQPLKLLNILKEAYNDEKRESACNESEAMVVIP